MEILRNIIWVALGGALGASLRYIIYLITTLISIQSYWSTLFVNILGSFLMGALISFIPEDSIRIKLFLATGVLGAFTTYSTFNADLYLLLQTKAWISLGTYLFISLFGAFLAFVLGFALNYSK